jgi:hypothetical protein
MRSITMINKFSRIVKAFALSCLLIIVIPMTAHAAFVAVGNGHNTANGNTITYTATAGNTLIVGAFTSAGGGSPTATIADNGTGSTWTTQLATTTFASQFVTFFTGVAGTGVTTITVTFSGGTPGNVFLGVLEYSGLSPTGFLGISTGNLQAVPGSAAGTGTNAVTSTNVNVTSQPAALIGWFWEFGGNGGGSAGTSPIAFTRRLNIAGIMTEDARVTATGNAVANATNSNASVDTMLSFAIAISEGSSGAALAGAASDTTSGTGALTNGSAPYVPIVIDSSGRSDQISLGSGPGTGTGDNADTAFTKLKQWASDLNSMLAQLYPSRSIQTPTTGFSIAAGINVTQLVLNPAGTLAAGTVTLPISPGDNQPFQLISSQTVTALTMNTSDGNTINGAPTTIAANTSVKFRFILSLGKWFRE